MGAARAPGNVQVFFNITCPWNFLQPLFQNLTPAYQRVQSLDPIPVQNLVPTFLTSGVQALSRDSILPGLKTCPGRI